MGYSYTRERDAQPVTFVDEVGKPHDALVTRDWSISEEPGAINLVYVSDDPALDDPYGQQIVRRTSVPHQKNQTAPGYFWK